MVFPGTQKARHMSQIGFHFGSGVETLEDE